MKILLALLSICLAFSLLAAENLQSHVRKITLAAGAGQIVTLGPDESVLIELISNPSTGYRWDADQLTRERRCFILSELVKTVTQTESSVSVVVGAPTTQQWSLRLDPEFACATEQALRWTYHRPWEPRSSLDPIVVLTLRTSVM